MCLNRVSPKPTGYTRTRYFAPTFGRSGGRHGNTGAAAAGATGAAAGAAGAAAAGIVRCIRISPSSLIPVFWRAAAPGSAQQQRVYKYVARAIIGIAVIVSGGGGGGGGGG